MCEVALSEDNREVKAVTVNTESWNRFAAITQEGDENVGGGRTGRKGRKKKGRTRVLVDSSQFPAATGRPTRRSKPCPRFPIPDRRVRAAKSIVPRFSTKNARSTGRRERRERRAGKGRVHIRPSVMLGKVSKRCKGESVGEKWKRLKTGRSKKSYNAPPVRASPARRR
jgi:hypothetical protein